MSHPMWVCGLKLAISNNLPMLAEVAPYVGVWIETLMLDVSEADVCRTLCGCVD